MTEVDSSVVKDEVDKDLLNSEDEDVTSRSMREYFGQSGSDGGEQCLICWRETQGSSNSGGTWPVFLPGSEGKESLNGDLWALFILRQLLDYPGEEVGNLMKKTGGISLGDWFLLCDECKETVREAISIYNELLRARASFERVQKQLRESIRNSFIGRAIKCNGDLLDTTAAIRKYFNKDNGRGTAKADDYEIITRKRRRIETSEKTTPLPIQPDPLDENSDNDDNDDSDYVNEDSPASAQNDDEDEDAVSSNNEESDSLSDFEPPEKPKRKRKALTDKLKAPPTTGAQIQCTVCLSKRLFTHSNALNRHMRRHQTTKHACPHCKFPCTSESMLYHHLQKNKCHPDYRYQCDSCEFVTERVCNLNQHKAAAHSGRSLDKKTKGKGKKLKKVKKEATFFSCDICNGFRCKYKSRFDYHVKMHQYFDNCEVIDGKLKCKVCGDLTFGPKDLRRHTREAHATELGILIFQCDMCVKSFSRQDSMEQHISQVHTKTCRFHCDQCDYGTNKKLSLERHKECHRVDRPYVCELCAATFKTVKAMRGHIKNTHSSSRSRVEFRCKFCGLDETVFLNKSLLNRHMRDVHKDLYVHKCDQCENDYLSAPSLMLHKKISHGNEPAECQFCQVKVLNEVYLGRHYKESCKRLPPDFNYKVRN